jgi:Flp pilus assembly protein TadD
MRHIRHRTLKAAAAALLVVFAATAFWSAGTNELDGDGAANVVAAADGAKVGTAEEGAAAEAAPKKKGSRWGRIFKAPFKAVAKVFGGGGDRPRRTSEGDVAKFESAPVLKVSDANSEPDPEPVRRKGADNAEAAREHFERGRARLNDGDLSAAITELSRAVSLDPRHGQAHNLLAVAYGRRGLHERARESFERSLDAQADAQSLNNAGYWFYLNGHYRLAVERLKRAAKMAPADERILNNLALAQARLGRFDDAYRSFARARGEYEGHMNTAALAERMGRDAAAAEHYEAAHKLQPRSETALRRLLHLYEQGGHGESAARTRAKLDGLQTQVAARE